MRHWLAGLGLVASVAVTGPASAQDGAIGPELSAYLDLSGGALFPVAGSVGGGSVGFFAAAGRANMNLRGAWDLQIDAQSLTLFGGGSSATVGGGFAHLYRRSGDHAVGLLGGGFIGNGAGAVSIGAEAVKFGPNAIVTGQALYYQFVGGGSGPKAVQGRLGVSYFFTENTAAYGEIMDTYLWSGTGSANVVTGILGLRHHYAGLPISSFAQVRFDYLSGIGTTATIGSALAGVTFHIGGGQDTLRQATESVPMLVRFPPVL